MAQKNKQQRQQQPAQPVALDRSTLLKQLNRGIDAVPLIKEIEDKRGARMISLVFNEGSSVPFQLTFDLLQPFEQVLSAMGIVPQLDLFLRSTGGMTEVPWRIISLLREFAEGDLGVIISKMALSGATHLAIAADELIMTPFAVIGSVDPTRNHPLLPKDTNGNPIPTSVQDLKHCIEFIREQLGKEYESKDLALIISELFKYIDPLAIGALEQSYKLSRLISEKALKTHRKPLEEQQIENIVNRLAGQYYSHAFLISRAEVESDLNLPVTKPDDLLSKLISNLDNYYAKQFENIMPITNTAPPVQMCVNAFLETTDTGWASVQITDNNNPLVTDRPMWLQYR